MRRRKPPAPNKQRTSRLSRRSDLRPPLYANHRSSERLFTALRTRAEVLLNASGGFADKIAGRWSDSPTVLGVPALWPEMLLSEEVSLQQVLPGSAYLQRISQMLAVRQHLPMDMTAEGHVLVHRYLAEVWTASQCILHGNTSDSVLMLLEPILERISSELTTVMLNHQVSRGVLSDGAARTLDAEHRLRNVLGVYGGRADTATRYMLKHPLTGKQENGSDSKAGYHNRQHARKHKGKQKHGKQQAPGQPP